VTVNACVVVMLDDVCTVTVGESIFEGRFNVHKPPMMAELLYPVAAAITRISVVLEMERPPLG
jgi:hypothetical protein